MVLKFHYSLFLSIRAKLSDKATRGQPTTVFPNPFFKSNTNPVEVGLGTFNLNMAEVGAGL